MAAKDFGPIANDYAFFMAHATEAEIDAAASVRALGGFLAGRTSVRLLDFGCGTGDFTRRLLAALAWPPEVLALTLIEPVEPQRTLAVQRLAEFGRRPLVGLAELPNPAGTGSQAFDVIIANHVLYYVDDLESTLDRMLESLAPRGRMLLAIAGWDNVLLKLWRTGFALLDRPVPYHVAEDVSAVLQRRDVTIRTTPTHYVLKFPDTAENRLKILRFLFGEHLVEIGPSRLLGEFDPFVRAGQVEIHTLSEHFTVEVPSRPSAAP